MGTLKGFVRPGANKGHSERIRGMKGAVATEYIKVSKFLGMEGNTLSLHIARLGDIIQQSHNNKLLNNMSQVVPLIFSYYVGRDKLTDRYRAVLDDYVADLMYLVDDYLQFTYNMKLT